MGFRRRHETHEVGAVGQGQAAVEPRRELRPCPWGVGSVCDQAGKCGRRAVGSAQREAIGAVMKTTVAALFGILLAAPAWAQIQPSGTFTPGHALRVLNSQGTAVGDAGGSAGSSTPGSGYLTELGITNTGTPLCINDALTNATSGYHQLCLGANALGGGLISYNAYGGATPLGVTANINGVSYSFPGTGSGNMLGPALTTSGAMVVWNSADGTLTANTAIDGYTSVVPPAPGVTSGLLPGFNTTGGAAFRRRTATATDVSDFLTLRDAEYTGGTHGFVNTAFEAGTHAAAGITAFEWTGLFVMDNDGVLADAAENAALDAKSIKNSTGSTWAAVFELRDLNTVAPSGSPVAVEMDVFANGADPSSNRTILHLVGNKVDPAGATPNIQQAIAIGDPSASANFTRGIYFYGNTYDIGIDFRGGAYTSAAIALADDRPITWSTDGVHKTYFDSISSTVLTTGPTSVSNTGLQSGLTFIGAMPVGVDLHQATYTSAAIWLPNNSPIAWNSLGTAKTFFDPVSSTVSTSWPMSVAGAAGQSAITVLAGTMSTGIDLRAGGYTSAAIWLEDNKAVNWDTAGTKQTVWDTATSTVKTTGDASVTGFMNAASYKVAGTAGVTGATCSAWTSGLCTAP